MVSLYSSELAYLMLDLPTHADHGTRLLMTDDGCLQYFLPLEKDTKIPYSGMPYPLYFIHRYFILLAPMDLKLRRYSATVCSP